MSDTMHTMTLPPSPMTAWMTRLLGGNSTNPQPAPRPAPVNPVPDIGPEPTGPDPVMHALLQQLEYTKQAPTTMPASSVSRVTVLPGASGGGGGMLPVVLIVLVLGAGWFFLSRKKGGGSKGGARKIEE